MRIKTNAWRHSTSYIQVTLLDDNGDFVSSEEIVYGWFFEWRLKRATRTLIKRWKAVQAAHAIAAQELPNSNIPRSLFDKGTQDV